MSSTTRCPFLPGAQCAPARPRSLACRIATHILLAPICIALTAPLHAAASDASDELATSGLYVLSGTGHWQGAFQGEYEISDLLGANRFYNAGLSGANAVMANIEAGYAWSAHETLTHTQLIPTSPGARGEVDRHATWVSMVMGGRPTVNDADHAYQRGLAPDAQFFSGAIATGWPNSPSFPRYTGSFSIDVNGISTYGPYRAAFITGLTAPDGSTRTADVVNSSYVSSRFGAGLSGTNLISGTLDALCNENPRTLLTFAAGNTLPSGAGPNSVASPASAYNVMAVAALAPNGGAFDVASAFSNGGPNDYADPLSTVSAVRQVIDIAAPGESFSTAYYGGQTGGNGPNVFGPANDPAGGPDWYTRSISGTSFAAPTVAGGAALLYDAAHARLSATPDARDARVMKAVLMNSAEKTVGWNNGQVAHPNGNGGVLTTRGLDDRVGAGRMNLGRAFEQLLWGTADVPGTTQGNLGTVGRIGWDYGLVAEGTDNDYLIDEILPGGARINATLDWFRDRFTQGTISFTDASLDNLDLELWEASGGTPTNLIAASQSTYNNSEHFSFNLPRTAQYLLRVRWSSELFDMVADVNREHYGFAWSVAVPEPTTVMLLLLASSVVLFFRPDRGPDRG